MRVGLDIGGASAKIGLVDAGGNVVRRGTIATGAEITGEGLVRHVSTVIRAWPVYRDIRSLGVASPGYRREDGAAMVNVVNLPELTGFPLRDRLRETLGIPIALDNDANLAAVGEYHLGGGAGARRLLVLTVGTGVGGGMLVAGEVLRVTNGGLGDPGHVLVSPEGPRCACGAFGCMEAVAAAPAILRRARELGGEKAFADFAAVARAAGRDEEPALQALAEAAGWLARGFASLAHILGPDRILVGGGVLDATGDLLLAPLRERFAEVVMPFFGAGLTLDRATLGNDAGLLGAASAAALLESS